MPCFFRACLVVALLGTIMACSEQPVSNIEPGLGQASADTGIDLSDDALLPPPAPELKVSARPGFLRFGWPALDTTDRIMLYSHDRSNNETTQLFEATNNQETFFDWPVSIHRFPWSSTSFHIDICSVDDCVSSIPQQIDELLPATITSLKSLPHNTSNQTLGINDGGYVAVIASADTASADVFISLPGMWVNTSQLSLPEAVIGSANGKTVDAMGVAVSANGDTIALSSMKGAASGPAYVTIFDRLGENWVDTSSFPVNLDNTDILLSADGNRLVAGSGTGNEPGNAEGSDTSRHAIQIFDRNDHAWQPIHMFAPDKQYQLLPAVSGSDSLQHLSVLSVVNDADVYLHSYQLTDNSWHHVGQLNLPALAARHDMTLAMSDNGDALAIAGWEIESSTHDAPVLLRLERNTQDPTDPAPWQIVESLRLSSINEESAQLQLAASDSLEQLVFGWKSADNMLMTVYGNSSYASENPHWQPVLNLANIADHTTNLTRINAMKFSGNGNVLLIGVDQCPEIPGVEPNTTARCQEDVLLLQ